MNLNDVESYLEGNFSYYANKLGLYPEYLQEQIKYRLSKCKDDCLPQRKCRNCTCPPKKKLYVTKSCNPMRFPDLMNKEDWNEYKERNNII